MAKRIYILLLLTFGFILGPTQSFSHNNKVEMACCMKESSTKECCKENHSKEKQHNCSSSCKDVSCGCPTVYCGYASVLSIQKDNNLIFDLLERKQKHFYSEIIISSDFHSIWLPPKIS